MAAPKKPKVMIADDETRVRAVVKKVMSSMGADVVAEAVNGKEALQMYNQVRPDLLLLDVNMPLLTGKEVLAEVMKTDPDAFVIMLTSVTKSTTVVECLEMGAAQYIRKDTKIQDMRKIIKDAWEDFKQKKGKPNA